MLSFAQFSLGVSAGANVGNFSGVEPEGVTYTTRTGMNLGATFAYRINQDISLLVQPMYSQRGSNIEVGEDTYLDSMEVYEAKIDFLIIPLIIRVDSDNGVTYFVSGLEFGIPLSTEIDHDGSTKEMSDLEYNIDILASIGMGFRFSIGKPDLIFEFRYYQGLTNFNSGDGEDQGILIFDDFKNVGFQLMAGVEWEL